MPRLSPYLLGSLSAALLLAGCQRASYPLLPSTHLAAQPTPATTLPARADSLSAAVVVLRKPAATPVAAATRPPRPRPAKLAQLPARTLRLLTTVAARHRPGVVAARHQSASAGPNQPARHKSRGIAALLLILLLPLGLYNFYLGYTGRGIFAVLATVLGFYLYLVGELASLFSSTAVITPALVVGLIILGGLEIWQLTDFVRILTGNLKPKDGEYNPRFFQTHPDSAAPPRP